MPLFSIIVPCWNAEKYLPATIASVQAQTCEDWELILLDDGSTDSTPDIIRAATVSDRRIHGKTLPNGGPSRARNTGALQQARGSILAFLDADDLWAPERLDIFAAAFADGPDALYSKVAFFKEDPARVSTYSTVPAGYLSPACLLRENPICTMSNVAVRTSVFRQTNGFDPEIVHGEDVEWLIRLAASGARIEGIEQTLVWYRANELGLSANLDAMRAGWWTALQTMKRLGIAPSASEVRSAEAVHLRYLARRALRIDAPRFAALRFAANGLARSPRAFCHPVRRGLPTLLAACAAPVMPRRLRRVAFSA